MLHLTYAHVYIEMLTTSTSHIAFEEGLRELVSHVGPAPGLASCVFNVICMHMHLFINLLIYLITAALQ